MLACVPSLFATPWTVTHQAPLFTEFPRQAYWNRLPWPPPGDLPDPETEPTSPLASALQTDSLPLSHLGYIYIQYAFGTLCSSQQYMNNMLFLHF